MYPVALLWFFIIIFACLHSFHFLMFNILMEGGVSVTKECKGLQMIVDSEWVYEFQVLISIFLFEEPNS